ncbi:MAG: hypothetical protein HFI69_02275 [Lachnospiraceae bacterium]|nr:hypothetical protein [Lachnospiraceae bacterium]
MKTPKRLSRDLPGRYALVIGQYVYSAFFRRSMPGIRYSGVYDTPSLCAGFLKLPESMISLAAYMLEWIVFLTEFARNRSGTGICFGKRTKHAHNVLLQMMHDYGIFMCVVYLIMLYNSL